MVATVIIVLTCSHLLRKIDDAIRPNATVFDSRRFGHPSGAVLDKRQAFV
jgi:hypothetical protein